MEKFHFPDYITVSVASINLLNSNHSDFIEIKFLKNSRHLHIVDGKSGQTTFDLNFHKITFDFFKIYIFQSSSKVGKIKIPISTLVNHDLVFTRYDHPFINIRNFNIYSESKNRKRPELLGSIGLLFQFPQSTDHFPSIDNLSPPFSDTSVAFMENDAISAIKNFNLCQHPYTRSDSVSSTSSSNYSTSSTFSTKSSLRYGGLSENTISGFKEFSEIRSSFFGSDWNLSKYQLLKSFTLVSKYFKTYRQYAPSGKTVSDLKKLEIAGYFMHFSLASYGTIALNYFGFGSGITDFMRVSPNLKSAMDLLRIPKEHFLAWEFGLPELYKPSFYVCWDDRTKAIVLAIRGTSNIHETIVDSVCTYTKFKNGVAHKGFLTQAQWLADNLLPKLIQWIEKFNSKSLYLVGHSMGGGSVSLFRMMLSDYTLSSDPSFNIKTVCFATTASCSLNLCKEYENEITSYVNVNDIIPKASYGSAKDLHDLIISASKLIEEKSTTEEKLKIIADAHQELLLSNKNPKLYVPGRVYSLYKTSRIGVDAHLEPHYVCELIEASQLVDLHFGENALFHHFLDKYDNSLRKAHSWLKKQSNHIK